MTTKVEESTLEVTLDLQGRVLRNVTSWSIDSDYLTDSDGFKLNCYSEDFSIVRGLEMQPVTLSVGGAQQLIGRIDTSTMGRSGQGNAIQYDGRDYLADMVTCAVDPNIRIKDGLDLFSAITLVAGPVGIDAVVSDTDIPLRDIRTGQSSVGEGAGRDFRTLKSSDVKPEGDKIFSFLKRIVARHGGTIQPYTDRNTVAITVPNYGQPARYKLLRRTGDRTSQNNVMRGVARRNFGNFPTYTLFSGRQTRTADKTVPVGSSLEVGGNGNVIEYGLRNTKSQSGVAALLYGAGIPGLGAPLSRTIKGFDGTKKYSTAEAAVGFSPSAADVILGTSHIGRRKPTDPTGDPLKLYRLDYYSDPDARNKDQLDRAAVRATGEKLKDTLVYDVEVQGHVDTASGLVWSVDTIVDVVDEVCDIAEPMWVAARTLEYTKEGGATTRMQLWRPGAFIP